MTEKEYDIEFAKWETERRELQSRIDDMMERNDKLAKWGAQYANSFWLIYAPAKAYFERHSNTAEKGKSYVRLQNAIQSIKITNVEE